MRRLIPAAARWLLLVCGLCCITGGVLMTLFTPNGGRLGLLWVLAGLVLFVPLSDPRNDPEEW